MEVLKKTVIYTLKEALKIVYMYFLSTHKHILALIHNYSILSTQLRLALTSGVFFYLIHRIRRCEPKKSDSFNMTNLKGDTHSITFKYNQMTTIQEFKIEISKIYPDIYPDFKKIRLILCRKILNDDEQFMSFPFDKYDCIHIINICLKLK
jgi:hypothetical protein